ncbi:hypothetical protein Gpo141_00013143 [Globisporangium polare]
MGFPEDEVDVQHAGIFEDEQLSSALAAKLEAATAESPVTQAPDDDADATATAEYDEAADAALAAAMSYEDPVFVSCQICMDVLLVDEAVTQLCGKTCAAEICAECLVQHLTATVYSFYPGVLPKVRCPICLNLMNKNVWKKFVKPEPGISATTTDGDTENTTAESVEDGGAVVEVEEEESEQQTTPPPAAETTAANADDNSWRFDHSHVLDKYEILCRQSCEFQSPCCHNPEYTMLPPFKAQDARPLKLPESQAAQVATLRKRCRAFCYHREDTKQFYEFICETFGENAVGIFWNVLSMILDEERRATLLLYHLFLHPDTYTLCCDEIVCFKCKASVHHAGQCSDFIEDDCVLQCRGCHVTLVKVDGCDSVSCVCGHSIHWPSEMEKQRAQRKQLAPEDDTVYTQWQHWTRKMHSAFAKIQALEATKREIRLHRMVREKRVVLRDMLLRYTSRKAEALNAQQEAVEPTPEVEAQCLAPETVLEEEETGEELQQLKATEEEPEVAAAA